MKNVMESRLSWRMPPPFLPNGHNANLSCDPTAFLARPINGISPDLMTGSPSLDLDSGKLFRHCQVFFQVRKRLGGPRLQVRVVPTLRILFEKSDCLLVRLKLQLIIGPIEFLARLGFKLVEFLLMICIE